jgi:hypothetical protein
LSISPCIPVVNNPPFLDEPFMQGEIIMASSSWRSRKPRIRGICSQRISKSRKTLLSKLSYVFSHNNIRGSTKSGSTHKYIVSGVIVEIPPPGTILAGSRISVLDEKEFSLGL